jgi:hypothetical protein
MLNGRTPSRRFRAGDRRNHWPRRLWCVSGTEDNVTVQCTALDELPSIERFATRLLPAVDAQGRFSTRNDQSAGIRGDMSGSIARHRGNRRAMDL